MRLRWPWSTLALTAAVVVVQADLWLARSNMPQVLSLTRQLAEQQAVNEAAEQRNRRTLAELSDLREGLEMVEERARYDLGMVKGDEILVQYTARPRAATGPGSPATSTSAAVPASPASPASPPSPAFPAPPAASRP